MSAIAVASIVFACVFGGALLGMFLRAALPDSHLSSDAKDVVKLGMGLIATMAALVLGLLIASAKSSYEAQSSGLEQISVDLVLLDGMLAHYGPEAKETRDLLRRTVAFALERVGPKEGSRSSGLDVPAGVSPVYVKILELSPRDDAQRWLHSQALQIGAGLARTRWLLIEEREDSSIPMPFLVVLVFWLTVLFASFGLFAPPNPTVIAVLVVCALSVSGAIFLILELDRPFAGVMQISSAPLSYALAHLGQ